MKSLDEVLSSGNPLGQMWFFQTKNSFLRQSKFMRWDASRLDDYVLIPAAAGFVNKTDCVFISHFWHSRQHPDPDGLDLNLLRQDVASSGCSFIWLDYTCLPQGQRTDVQSYYFQVALRKLPILMRDCGYAWRFPSFQPRLWILFEVACWFFNHAGCVEYDDMAPYVADCKRMVDDGVGAVVAQRGYRCTNGSDTQIVTSWLELLVLLNQHVPSTTTRRAILDATEGYFATTELTLEYIGAEVIRIEPMGGTLSVGHKTYDFTPLPAPSVARPSETPSGSSTSLSMEAFTPEQEKELIEAAKRDLESGNPVQLEKSSELIAGLLERKSNLGEAETLARAIRAHVHRPNGEPDVSAITSTHRLALVCKAVGKQQECEALLDETLSLKAQVIDGLMQKREFGLASIACRRIVDFNELYLSKGDNEVIRDYGVLGTCLSLSCHYTEADEYLGLSADMADRFLGRDHSFTRKILLDFANNCAMLGRLEDAEEALKKVGTVPDSHPHAVLVRQSRKILLQRRLELAARVSRCPA